MINTVPVRGLTVSERESLKAGLKALGIPLSVRANRAAHSKGSMDIRPVAKTNHRFNDDQVRTIREYLVSNGFHSFAIHANQSDAVLSSGFYYIFKKV